MLDTAILAPGAALICWTLVMLLWMALTRFPAMKKAGVDIGASPGGRGQDLEAVLDPRVNWKAHNYTHLVEQPTLFYAVIIILSLTGGTDALSVGLAWAYTVIRIVHSVWQATVNKVPFRSLLFFASSICLIILAVLALLKTL